MTDTPDEIQWHPAFYAAAGIELQENMDDLEFTPEYNLSKEPIHFDLLIRNDGAVIKNEIGHIMRKYNIIEYKSPRDAMTIDDFAKSLGYALLFKGFGEKVNAFPMEKLTVSMFRAAYPREMFAELKKEGHEIEEKYPGIYYVRQDLPFPVQVIVTKELSPETHSSLRILTDHAEVADIRRFLEQAKKMERPGDRDNIDAVLQVSVAANFELYEEVRRDSVMCQAMRELMKDEIAEDMLVARREGREEGRIQGQEEGLLASICNLMKSMEWSSEQAMEALGVPENKMDFYRAKLVKL
jgi:hypothetical protein